MECYVRKGAFVSMMVSVIPLMDRVLVNQATKEGSVSTSAQV